MCLCSHHIVGLWTSSCAPHIAQIFLRSPHWDTRRSPITQTDHHHVHISPMSNVWCSFPIPVYYAVNGRDENVQGFTSWDLIMECIIGIPWTPIKANCAGPRTDWWRTNADSLPRTVWVDVSVGVFYWWCFARNVLCFLWQCVGDICSVQDRPLLIYLNVVFIVNVWWIMTWRQWCGERIVCAMHDSLGVVHYSMDVVRGTGCLWWFRVIGCGESE